MWSIQSTFKQSAMPRFFFRGCAQGQQNRCGNFGSLFSQFLSKAAKQSNPNKNFSSTSLAKTTAMMLFKATTKYSESDNDISSSNSVTGSRKKRSFAFWKRSTHSKRKRAPTAAMSDPASHGSAPTTTASTRKASATVLLSFFKRILVRGNRADGPPTDLLYDDMSNMSGLTGDVDHKMDLSFEFLFLPTDSPDYLLLDHDTYEEKWGPSTCGTFLTEIYSE
jgi:hypothetical protein